MESFAAIAILSALAQSTRLETFRLLMRNEPDGLPAGKLARLLDTPQNTMSAHLSILSRAGLIEGERHSRSIIYRARLDKLRDLTLFLLKDCCGGNAAVCAPLIAELNFPIANLDCLGMTSRLQGIGAVEGSTRACNKAS